MTVKWVETLPSKGLAQKKRKSTKKPKKPRFWNIMELLKQNPGQWANVINYHSRFTAANAATTFRNNGFESAVRKAPGGWYKVFARYVPEPK